MAQSTITDMMNAAMARHDLSSLRALHRHLRDRGVDVSFATVANWHGGGVVDQRHQVTLSAALDVALPALAAASALVVHARAQL